MKPEEVQALTEGDVLVVTGDKGAWGHNIDPGQEVKIKLVDFSDSSIQVDWDERWSWVGMEDLELPYQAPTQDELDEVYRSFGVTP